MNDNDDGSLPAGEVNVRAWMKFFPADWVSGTRKMPLAARGLYIDLLCESWREGGLDDDPEILARLCGVGLGEFAPLWDRWVRRKFEVDEATGLLVNPKLEAVRAKQLAMREKGRERQKRYRERHKRDSNAPSNALQGGGTQDSGLRTQVSGREGDARAREVGVSPESDSLETLLVGSPQPPWIEEILRGFLSHALSVPGVVTAPKSPAVWKANAEGLRALGEDAGRMVWQETLRRGKWTLAGGMDWYREKGGKGKPEDPNGEGIWAQTWREVEQEENQHG